MFRAFGFQTRSEKKFPSTKAQGPLEVPLSMPRGAKIGA